MVKVCEQNDLFAKEINAMKNIWRKGQSLQIDGSDLGKTPEVKAYGLLISIDSDKAQLSTELLLENEDNYKVFSYVIMPRYGLNLEDLFDARGNQLTPP